MEKGTIELTLPHAPRGLCFDRNDFVKTNFSVDNFLAEHQNVASLETMRDDLGAYLKVLRLAMIELINKDYANFVNLSATLIGFDKAISKIQVPLEHLNEEVLAVKQCLDAAMKELSTWLNQRHTLQKKKQILKYYSQVVNSLTTLEKILNIISEKKKYEKIVLADRATMQYNHLKFSISKCEILVKAEQKTQYKNIERKLIQILNELLFTFWNDNDENSLLKTLITLASLDRVSETETLLRKQAIAPLLQGIISESSLQKNANGLQGIYDLILSLLNTKLKPFFTVMQHSKLSFLVTKYNFIVNCFWCEVESRLEVNLASIFAPGNPKIFYRRYTESMLFVKKLEEYCLDVQTVQLLHVTKEYKSFQRKWNLPVYFQIRFQEIAGNYEAILKGSPNIEPKDGFVLKETHNCWKALQECWSEGIYVEALAHKFWKLSLQLLSRYATWSSIYCSQRRTSKIEATCINKDLLDNSINIYIDTQALLQRLPTFLEFISNKIPLGNNYLLKQSMKYSEETLSSMRHKIRECIVNELFDYFNTQLKQVSDIPRLYRKTNRSVPKKPCAYIEVIGKTINEFNEDASKRLDNIFLTELYVDLFNVMTVSYYKYVEDVLNSVQRTEDSLRRLKQIREVAQQSSDNTGITDGEKIRLQLNVDVVSYGRLAESVRVNVHSVQRFKELSSMVTDAVKNIDIK